MRKFASKICALSRKQVEDYGAQYELFGTFAVVNYIVPYFMWSPSQGSNYSLLIFLRLIAGIMCFLLIMKDYWKESFLAFLPLYWHITLLYCLPFLTTFMLFDSHGSTFWLINVILALLLLAVLVDWISFVVILVLGMFLGYSFYTISGNRGPLLISSDTLSWVIYLGIFSVIIGILFSRRKEKIAAEKLDAYKIVSSSIAHEMRTPLSSMYISAEGVKQILPNLLKTYEIALKHKLDIPHIDKTRLQLMKDLPTQFMSISRRSLSVIDIFLTKFGSIGNNHFETKLLSMDKLIKKAINEYPFYPPSMKDKIQYEQGKDFIFKGDESLLIHLFSNLIKNSLFQIQVAKKGHVKIWLEQKGQYNIVHFYDNAKGIKPSSLSKIFDSFYAGTNHGTGIGLAYCKKVMDVCQGKIDCQSTYGEFAEFRLFFPIVHQSSTDCPQ